ncbi:signal peptide peptidase SppA [bacterium]|nr:signal peptide peptidase SppA [bacterium]
MNIYRIIKGIIYFTITILLVYLITLVFSLYFGNRIITGKEGKIGLINVEGVIISSKSFIKQLERFSDDDSVKAIVIRIDSGGGGVAPSQEMYEAVINFKKETKKKVVVSFGNIAASGGYYVACAADKIVSNPGTITGSISVIMRIPNLQSLFKKLGYEEQIVKSGKFKDIGSISRAMTKEERAILEDMMLDVHEQFIEAISRSRNIDLEYIREIADGRIFSGRQAKELNLVDNLGTMEDAIDLAGKLAGISGKPKVLSEKKKLSFFEFAKDFFEQSSYLNPFGSEPIKLQYRLF